ncbi:dihydroxy-acid dehydratase [Sporolactobacillus sp. THM19-2]|uniref:dihydroxy-acid dehydratase n=1 Tax=Sporolactobacillus sp. THM19-2 TaxID=2511171 RepID=UPI0010224BA6|nr:dihydroxy-acid dehydratase [Sporolactobacillus sp. THM19-2]RYL88152.1 dihydroxy-acid dehydratase [Sporolactobacillus sp. THM19-2]
MQNRLSQIKPYTRAILKGHLCSSGVPHEMMDRPIIAIANSWNEIVPGHVHLRKLAEYVKKGVLEAGGYPLEFNTIAVCDGIAQGHDGMKYSLPSRDIIADSVEIMIRAHEIFDGMVMLSSCDKIVPGMLMSAARVNLPSVVVLGGVMPNYIKPKESKAARQQFLSGELDEDGLVAVTRKYYPCAGVCPFLGTANTMQGLSEALGMALPGTSWMRSQSDEQFEAARAAGRQAVELAKKNIRARDILTKEAFENAISVLLAMGGSLNACLHLPAIAKEAGIDLALDTFDRLSRKVPFIAAVTPNNNNFTTNDLQRAGGVPALMKELSPLLHLDALTVTGKTAGENIKGAKVHDREIIHPLDQPIEPEGGIAVLKGNLADQGALIKQSAVPEELMRLSAPAMVFNSEEQFQEAYSSGKISENHVIVIRYEGPKGGPGMRELHRCTEILSRFKKIALITDGRFSGASAGLSVGYMSPEAAEGGPLALVKNDDIITIDVPERSIELEVSERELAERSKELNKIKHTASKFLKLYAESTASAAHGAVRMV